MSASWPVKPICPSSLVSQLFSLHQLSSLHLFDEDENMCHFSVFSYFRSLIEQFEVQLQQYRQQIEELENHLTTQSSGSHITPQGKRTFVWLISCSFPNPSLFSLTHHKCAHTDVDSVYIFVSRLDLSHAEVVPDICCAGCTTPVCPRECQGQLSWKYSHQLDVVWKCV